MVERTTGRRCLLETMECEDRRIDVAFMFGQELNVNNSYMLLLRSRTFPCVSAQCSISTKTISGINRKTLNKRRRLLRHLHRNEHNIFAADSDVSEVPTPREDDVKYAFLLQNHSFENRSCLIIWQIRSCRPSRRQ